MTESWSERRERETREARAREIQNSQDQARSAARQKAAETENNARVRAELEALATELGVDKVLNKVAEVWKVGAKHQSFTHNDMYEERKKYFLEPEEIIRHRRSRLTKRLEDEFTRFVTVKGNPTGHYEDQYEWTRGGSQGDGESINRGKKLGRKWFPATPDTRAPELVKSFFEISIYHDHDTEHRWVELKENRWAGPDTMFSPLGYAQTLNIDPNNVKGAAKEMDDIAYQATNFRIEKRKLPLDLRKQYGVR